MSTATRRIMRASVIALMAACVPGASAIGQALELPGAHTTPFGEHPYAWREEATNTAGNIAVAAEQAAVRETARRAAEAREDARVAAAIQREASRLTPGNYVWRPERAATGAVEIVVSIAAQRAYVFRNRKLIGVSTVSTGRPGNETPSGAFPILERKRQHFSNLYNNAPMPNMQRLTWDGIALHAGAIPGRPASHGCVRLPMAFSDLLFGVTRRGSIVHIVDGNPPSAVGSLAFALNAGGGGTQTARAR